MSVANATSVEDVVAEGDDVVSVSYYTVGGTALEAPVKGINIVVKVYANGEHKQQAQKPVVLD